MCVCVYVCVFVYVIEGMCVRRTLCAHFASVCIYTYMYDFIEFTRLKLIFFKFKSRYRIKEGPQI